VSEIVQRAAAEIQKRKLLSRGQKILVGVSGGADSMVLLHVLRLLAKENRWQVSVAHFNHHLRGRASDADEKMVRLIAGKYRLKFFEGRADVKQFAAQSKLSIEMAARKLRHEFFAGVARAQKISCVALAHHADDQVELFFLRLLRGAGGEGLAGMKWCSPSPADKKVRLIRPLLGCTKSELLAFAAENKILFRADATNASSDILRNKIRNELLPLLRKSYQPGLSKTVLRLMEIVGAEAEFVGATARNVVSTLQLAPVRSTAEGDNFSDLPVAVQRKVLQLQLTEAAIVSDFELVEHLRQTPGKFVSVGLGLAVARDEAGKIETRHQSVPEFNPAELKLSGRGGRVEFGGNRFRWSFEKHDGAWGLPPQQLSGEFFDADKVGSKITLRHWCAGDRFQPIGLKSSAKLQDLFVNAKIPAARRRELVLAMTAAGEIFWVEGLRISEQFKLTKATKRRLNWRWAR
jgi:tRNA(Ile)-lysidine synthase